MGTAAMHAKGDYGKGTKRDVGISSELTRRYYRPRALTVRAIESPSSRGLLVRCTATRPQSEIS